MMENMMDQQKASDNQENMHEHAQEIARRALAKAIYEAVQRGDISSAEEIYDLLNESDEMGEAEAVN